MVRFRAAGVRGSVGSFTSMPGSLTAQAVRRRVAAGKTGLSAERQMSGTKVFHRCLGVRRVIDIDWPLRSYSEVAPKDREGSRRKCARSRRRQRERKTPGSTFGLNECNGEGGEANQ